MTGFIPAGEGQYMHMCESTGLHLSIKEFRADEGQSTEEKVWDIGPDGTVREPRGLDFASQEEPKKGFSQNKIPPDAHLGFPDGSDGKEESACQCRRPGFDPWVRRIPWRRQWLPTPVFLPGESHGQWSLRTTVCGVE